MRNFVRDFLICLGIIVVGWGLALTLGRLATVVTEPKKTLACTAQGTEFKVIAQHARIYANKGFYSIEAPDGKTVLYEKGGMETCILADEKP